MERNEPSRIFGIKMQLNPTVTNFPIVQSSPSKELVKCSALVADMAMKPTRPTTAAASTIENTRIVDEHFNQVLTVMNEPKIILGQYADQSSQQRASSNHQ
jgi:hypothetical protein